MRDEKIEYRRLPGASRTQTGSLYPFPCSLWLAPDHVLSVLSEGFTETYKRFYFRDIQAFVIRRTRRGAITSVLLGGAGMVLLALVFAGAALQWPSALAAILGSCGAVCLALLAVNVMRGPTCVCHVRTAVQMERLYPLNRLPVAARAVAVMRQAVESVQGSLTEEEVDRALAALPPPATDEAGAEAATQYAGALRRRRSAGTPVHYSGWAHTVLCFLLVIDFCDSASRFVMKDGLMQGSAAYLFLFLSIAFIVISLVKQHNSDLSPELKGVGWCALAYMAAGLVFITGYEITTSIIDPKRFSEAHEFPSPLVSPLSLGVTLFSGVCAGVLGFGGLALLKQHLRRQSVPPSLPAGAPPPEPIAPPDPSPQPSVTGRQEAPVEKPPDDPNGTT